MPCFPSLDNDLVDEINLLIFPVVVGQGTRLLRDTGPDTALELVESQTTPSGVTIQVYRPTRRPQCGTATADMKHVTYVGGRRAPRLHMHPGQDAAAQGWEALCDKCSDALGG